jgi:ssDNA-binding Zn-finger/Zn-ribbon topoisomerase 1
MANLETRIDRLEQDAGVNGDFCGCCDSPDIVELAWQDEGQPEPEPQMCPKCGKVRRLIVVRYEGEE